jgi:hypothetical protein
MSRVAASSGSSGRARLPSWLNPRVIAGIVLVLVATVVGALVIGRTERTSRVWATTRALAPGIVLRADDLQAVTARLPSEVPKYLRAGDKGRLVGLTVNRTLSADELLPASALSGTPAGTTVSVPLPSGDAPPITRGQRVRLWMSTHRCKAVVVLTDVAVQDVTSSSGGTFGTGGGQTIVVRVPADEASRVVLALGIDSAVMRAAVLSGPPFSYGAPEPSLANCADE